MVDRPPLRAAGELDRPRREAILRFAGDTIVTRTGGRLSEDRIFDAWLRAEFLSSIGGALQETAVRYGLPRDTLTDQFKAMVADIVDSGVFDASPYYSVSSFDPHADALHAATLEHGERLALLVLPDPEFLTAIEHAVARYAGGSRSAKGNCRELMAYAGQALRAHAVPYQLDASGMSFVWSGDQTLHESAVEPALAALGDRRLAGARDEFRDALVKRRAGRAPDLRDAIHEAGSATESVMVVLIEQHGVTVPKQKAASALFNALAAPGATASGPVIPGYLQHLALAAAEIRNHSGAHGQGAAVTAPPTSLADAAIAASGAAIVALVEYL